MSVTSTKEIENVLNSGFSADINQFGFVPKNIVKFWILEHNEMSSLVTTSHMSEANAYKSNKFSIWFLYW